MASTIHDEVERMAGLINNLLNISKMDTGTLHLVPKRVKLHDLLQDAFGLLTFLQHGDVTRTHHAAMGEDGQDEALQIVRDAVIAAFE